MLFSTLLVVWAPLASWRLLKIVIFEDPESAKRFLAFADQCWWRDLQGLRNTNSTFQNSPNICHKEEYFTLKYSDYWQTHRLHPYFADLLCRILDTSCVLRNSWMQDSKRISNWWNSVLSGFNSQADSVFLGFRISGAFRVIRGFSSSAIPCAGFLLDSLCSGDPVAPCFFHPKLQRQTSIGNELMATVWYYYLQ